MISFTLEELAHLARLSLTPEQKSQVIDHVSTNSNDIGQNCLFVPLKGERFDGHSFIAGAIAQGAVAYASCQEASPEGALKVSCANTLRLLGKCGELVRRKSPALICAITGSCGKTTVKEMTAAILSEAGTTHYTHGNFNNDVGVPLTLLQLTLEHQYAVIEQGASHLLDIARTAEFVEADFALITNVGAAHIAGFGSQEGVYYGKSEILDNLFARFPERNDDGLLPLGRGIGIVPADSEFWPKWQQDYRKELEQGRLLSFGSSQDATMRVTNITKEGSTLSFNLTGLDVDAHISLNTLGRHNAINAAGAALLARVMGATPAQIVSGLKKSQGLSGRLTPQSYSCGLTVIDDAYNASFNAVIAALDTLSQMDDTRIMVFGDMGELGQSAPKLHTEVGVAAQDKVDVFFALGPLSENATAALQGTKVAAYHCADHAELKDKLYQLITAELKAGHKVTCLIKGAHAMQMDKAVAALKELGSSLVSL